jgi:hypothetical protein
MNSEIINHSGDDDDMPDDAFFASAEKLSEVNKQSGMQEAPASAHTTYPDGLRVTSPNGSGTINIGPGATVSGSVAEGTVHKYYDDAGRLVRTEYPKDPPAVPPRQA